MASPIVGAAALVGGAIAAIGVESIKLATAFDQQMYRVQAITDATQVHIQGVQDTAVARMAWYKQQILQLAPTIDVDPTKLAAGLYFVISAGFHGAQAMDVLKYSAMAAAATMSDFSGVADAVTSLMNAYKRSALDAGTATDVLTRMVVMGKMEFKNVVASLGIIGITSQVAGFKVQEMAAAMATLSQVSGSHAIRRIGMEFMNMERQIGINIASVEAAAKKNKIAFDINAFATMNLIQKLQYLAKISGGVGYLDQAQAKAYMATGNIKNLAAATAQANSAFLKLVGGAAAFIPAAILLSDKGKEYNYILGQMTTHGQATAQAFASMRESTGQKWNMFKVTLDSIGITIGLHLLPAVNTLLMGLINLGRSLIPILGGNQWATIKSAVTGIAIVIGTILTPALVTAALAAAPFVAAVVGIVGAGILLGRIIDHFGGLANIISRVTGFFQKNEVAMTALKAVGAALLGVLLALAATALPTLVTGLVILGIYLQGVIASAVVAAAPFVAIGVAIAALVFGILMLVQHWKQVQAFLGNFGGVVKDALGNAKKAVGDFFGGIGDWIGSALSDAGAAIGNFFQSLGTGIQQGIQTVVNAIMGAGVWLYQHNYYFQHFIDGIRVAVFYVSTIVPEKLNELKGHIEAIWDDLQAGVNIAWTWIRNNIVNNVAAGVNTVRGWIVKLGAWLQAGWTAIQQSVRRIFEGILYYIESLGSRAGGAVKTGVIDPIGHWFNQMVQGALIWGKMLIQNFINGAKSQFGNLANMAKQGLQTVAGWFGFHSPAPNVPESAQWGPNLIRMMAQGILATSPLLGTAASTAIAQLQRGLTSSAALANLSVAANGAAGATRSLAGGSSGPVTHNWNLSFPNAVNADQIRKAVLDIQQETYRRAGRAGGYQGSMLRGAN